MRMDEVAHLLETMPLAAYRTDADGYIEAYNTAAIQLWGQRPRTGRGRWSGAYRLHRPDGRPVPLDECTVALSLKHGRVIDGVELVAERPDGTSVRFLTHTSLIRTASGEVSGSLNMLTDVSHLDSSHMNEELLAALVESSDDAIISKNLDGTITSWNRGAIRLFGYRSDEMIGEDIVRLIPPRLLHEESMIVAKLKNGDRVDHFETVRLAKDGTEVNVSLTISPIHDRAGNIIGASKIARAIDERRAFEDRIRQSQKLEALGQLTGGIAHDFNNLLTVITGNMDLLSARVMYNKNMQTMVEMTSAAARRGAELTGHLLAFARQQPLEACPVDVGALIANMNGMLQRALTSQIGVNIVVADGLWNAMIDATQLESALLNIAINARDAMPAGGQLTVEAKNVELDKEYATSHAEVLPGDYVMVSVSDTGVGMDRATLAKVFEPFFTTKKPGSGTGLGLSMVFGFVKQSKGHVSIYSEVGAGTSVKLYLPRTPGASAIPDEDKKQAAATPRGEEKILLVEDDEIVAETTEVVLRSLGYDVEVATDGKSALAILEDRNDFDLLLTDMIMPGGMSGQQLVARVRSVHPDMKVLFTSGYTESAVIAQERLAVGEHFISKPWRRATLAAKLRGIFEPQN